MQPLTPNERREIEATKELIIKGWQTSDCKIAHWQEFDYGQDELILHVHNEDWKELWLKVLSMALQQNEVLEENWRKR